MASLLSFLPDRAVDDGDIDDPIESLLGQHLVHGLITGGPGYRGSAFFARSEAVLPSAEG